MFEIRIGGLREFRVFVKIIRGEDIKDEEIQKLSEGLGDSADKLLAAEAAQMEKKEN